MHTTPALMLNSETHEAYVQNDGRCAACGELLDDPDAGICDNDACWEEVMGVGE